MYYIRTITMESNNKDIKIGTEEDIGLDDKIKAGVKAVGKKIKDPDKDIGVTYKAEKTKEKVVDSIVEELDQIDEIINKF
jgi:hypothetical protein